MKSRSLPVASFERPLTLRAAAEATGLPYFKLQRAAQSGAIPTYTFFNSRKYVKLSDITKAMSAAS
ncbi:hypothetical protein [Microvirga brassicacearum]|uniref:Helix-turn-helix domain-containing protein n=1 Tax=Microvirga brassicacearum TaxID=2580413 RepID=A0A5N3P4U2_9HYPH|nr:hypothetical protein [Microvirga brassicacearum]KAB0264734.1 hypothetical protein FEZ63_22050 [Microvirga brassicacearum]